MIRKNWAQSHNFRDIVEFVADCGAEEISLIYLLHQKMQNTFHQSTLKLCLII